LIKCVESNNCLCMRLSLPKFICLSSTICHDPPLDRLYHVTKHVCLWCLTSFAYCEWK
jgi:hypothetical protein